MSRPFAVLRKTLSQRQNPDPSRVSLTRMMTPKKTCPGYSVTSRKNLDATKSSQPYLLYPIFTNTTTLSFETIL
jgi:hypothetical protein